MSAIINEHTQWVDSDGKPLNAGKLYIGTVGGDPVATAGATTIYSDRDLSVSIANPQTLDANGRTTNKIWFDGKYSLQVNNSAAVQKYQELDAGEASSGVHSVPVTGISGSDVITGNGTPTLAAYTDLQILKFTATSPNTGAVTFNVNGVGAKAIVKFDDVPLVKGDIVLDQSVELMTNTANDNFVLMNPRLKTIQFEEAAPVASAASPDIWGGDGNTLHITGTDGITGFAAAPNVGARRKLIFDDIVTLTHSANLNLPGAADFSTAAGDVLEVYADTLTQFDVSFKGNFPASTAEGTTGTATRRFPSVAGVAAMIVERNLPAFEFIETADLSNVATVAFTGFDASKYDSYQFDIMNVIPVTNNQLLHMRTSSDGGGGYDSGAANYRSSAAGAATRIEITGTIGGDAGEDGVSGVVHILGPHLAFGTIVIWNMGYTDNNNVFIKNTGSAERVAAEDVDAVQFAIASGNLESGTITMYGRRNV